VKLGRGDDVLVSLFYPGGMQGQLQTRAKFTDPSIPCAKRVPSLLAKLAIHLPTLYNINQQIGHTSEKSKELE